MASAIKRNVPAPKAWDADFKPQPGDSNAVVVINLTTNIIEVPIGDDKGKPVLLGASIDRGIVGAAQPEHETTAGVVRRARMNPAVDMMFAGNRPALEVRGRLYTGVDIGEVST
jgi:hypothetical protein